MQIKIAENIKALRKAKSLTQEQLAEALGVTVGAVYKWEVGMSMPEVRMLVELAEFFEISIDALLGYQQQHDSVRGCVIRIRQSTTNKDFEGAEKELEKALQKYPNYFDVVYSGAVMYQLKFTEDRDKQTIERSNELFQRAISLLYQNQDTGIGEVSIYNQIANNYMMMGDMKKALEMLKQNNVCHVNSATIGFLHAVKLQQPKEAEPYLLQAFMNILGQVIFTMTGLVSMYGHKKDERAAEAALWACDFLDSMKAGEGVTYTDKLKAIFMTLYAVQKASEGCLESAREVMEKAYILAKQFDEAPVYHLKGIRFVNEEYESLSCFDGLGNTAREAVENQVFQKKSLSEAEEFVKQVWEELKHGKNDF